MYIQSPIILGLAILFWCGVAWVALKADSKKEGSQ